MKKIQTTNKKLIDWVNKIAKLCVPEQIVWIDGSQEQKRILENESVDSGELIRLNQEKLPGCFLHRTAHDDVARTLSSSFLISNFLLTLLDSPYQEAKHSSSALPI